MNGYVEAGYIVGVGGLAGYAGALLRREAMLRARLRPLSGAGVRRHADQRPRSEQLGPPGEPDDAEGKRR